MTPAAVCVALAGVAGQADAAISRYDLPLPKARPLPASPAPPSPEIGADGLAVGITEPNANFLWPERVRTVPRQFAPWRAELSALRPAVYRLIVDWATLQPRADVAPGAAIKSDGCTRSNEPPCGAYQGLREQLRAIRAQQLARPDGRWQVLVVVAGTPTWAASPPGGCESPGAQARSRPPRVDTLRDYQDVVAQINRIATREGVAVRYWSAWNEPNHPYTVSPQRKRCARRAGSAIGAPYARLARALQQALDRMPGEQWTVLGEAAGFTRPTARGTTVGELIRALPRDVVCSTQLWSQHAYVGATNPVPVAIRALDRRGCPFKHRVWVTETGAPGPQRIDGRRVSGVILRRSCRALEQRLQEWWRDPRVDVAMQYTLREDPVFPTGLVASNLRRAYPMLALWRAWGADRPTAEPVPRGACDPWARGRALRRWLVPGV